MGAGNKLKITTPSDQVIVMTREFDAPRRLVWEAMTKPELIRRWLFAPDGWEMVICEEDVRVGGAYHWAWRGPDGQIAMAIRGEYREVMYPERLVRTEQFEFGCNPMGGQNIGTVTLTEQAGRTTLTTHILYPSKEARDAMVRSGMERGVSAGYDQIDELLKDLK